MDTVIKDGVPSTRRSCSMNSPHIAAIASRVAQDILACCHAACQELGLTLADVSWGYSLSPALSDCPYRLWIHVIEPLEMSGGIRFTHDEIAGYATGKTTFHRI